MAQTINSIKQSGRLTRSVQDRLVPRLIQDQADSGQPSLCGLIQQGTYTMATMAFDAGKVSIETLFVQLEKRGNGAYGLSDVTQLAHALQAAALAGEQGLPDAMIVAALFHDVGHLVSEEDVDLAAEGIDDKHEIASADALEPLFGPAVSEPVRLHVPAKRYLCTTEPDYFDKLSEDSRVSLKLQGGLMTEAELLEFTTNPHYENGVILRRIDDQAKQPGLNVPPIGSYRDMANACAVSELNKGE